MQNGTSRNAPCFVWTVDLSHFGHPEWFIGDVGGDFVHPEFIELGKEKPGAGGGGGKGKIGPFLA
jgi:hypothetical protein